MLAKVEALNKELEGLGKPFFDGKSPGATDAKKLKEVIGDNEHFYRWLKFMASHTAEERAAFPAPEKKKVINKSSIVLDVKPWDDETDLQEMERAIRSITMEGLHWGASKLVPVAFGVKKLQIMLTIIDDLVGSDDIEEKITALDDYVQSMDVVSWNKV
eukprot:TRINITY_DN8114_c0_g1_i1.p1 TRINITY_DN8114_c0_g1~~TRINITY_DN8114_c0_g1_i1.p1  ORF type:complete len:159 (-),score=35.26 TRINITY_DN8114_c0_g1_i1:86-562(-)